MREIITKPQQSDMGSGFGCMEGVDGHTLKEVLDFYKAHSNSWGTVSVFKDGILIEESNYNTYSANIFPTLAAWKYPLIVKEVKFDYCFMNKDVDIFLY